MLGRACVVGDKSTHSVDFHEHADAIPDVRLCQVRGDLVEAARQTLSKHPIIAGLRVDDSIILDHERERGALRRDFVGGNVRLVMLNAVRRVEPAEEAPRRLEVGAEGQFSLGKVSHDACCSF
jgi:hypothetical protein